jgi:hypothetical protein
MAGKQEGVKCFYDETSVECKVELPRKISSSNLQWQLVTPHGRVMAQGQIVRNPADSFVTVSLKFDKLEEGISLKCFLQIKRQGRIIGKQNLIIYSRKIFKDIAGTLKKNGAGAILPGEQILKLNELGLELPERPLDNMENPANKLIFCEAKRYCDNIEMLKVLMSRKLTLVMLAPDNETEIYVPMKKIAKICLISSKTAKTESGLGVIYSKEKILVNCSNGLAGIFEVEYEKGRIIIVAASLYKALDKIPEAALILKKSLINK